MEAATRIRFQSRYVNQHDAVERRRLWRAYVGDIDARSGLHRTIHIDRCSSFVVIVFGVFLSTQKILISRDKFPIRRD